GKNSLNRLIRCVCGKKIGPDPRNFNQRVSLGRNDLLIRTFLRTVHGLLSHLWTAIVVNCLTLIIKN
ncbi:acid stress response protein YqgB, partial [Klebsiella pneumoniae]|uniref:acid stress response protein YqgB n=1 Tax=Klebsiella pneumoniae TaxID=573 RepID=UPI0035A26F45